jgi:hypothetical protein
MAGGHDQLGRVVGIGRAEGAGLARNAGIELTVAGAHGELDDRAVLEIVFGGHLRRRRVVGAEDEVAVCVRGREAAIRQLRRSDIARSVRIAGGRRGTVSVLRGRGRLRVSRGGEGDENSSGTQQDLHAAIVHHADGGAR